MKRLSRSHRAARRLFKSLERGKFHKIMSKKEFVEWNLFIRRAVNTPHRERVILRLTMGDASNQKWYLWVAYRICEAGGYPHLHMDSLYTPQSDESRFITPEVIEGEPFFELEGV